MITDERGTKESFYHERRSPVKVPRVTSSHGFHVFEVRKRRRRAFHHRRHELLFDPVRSATFVSTTFLNWPLSWCIVRSIFLENRWNSWQRGRRNLLLPANIISFFFFLMDVSSLKRSSFGGLLVRRECRNVGYILWIDLHYELNEI